MGLSFTFGASLARVPQESWPHFTASDSRLPQPGGPGPHMCIPPGQDGPGIPPGTGFPFRRLLRLAGLRWKYSTPPPHGRSSHRTSERTYIEHRLHHLFYCLVTSRRTRKLRVLHRKAVTYCCLLASPSNDWCLQSHLLATDLLRHNMYCDLPKPQLDHFIWFLAWHQHIFPCISIYWSDWGFCYVGWCTKLSVFYCKAENECNCINCTDLLESSVPRILIQMVQSRSIERHYIDRTKAISF
jgi:hypothetical protein